MISLEVSCKQNHCSLSTNQWIFVIAYKYLLMGCFATSCFVDQFIKKTQKTSNTRQHRGFFKIAIIMHSNRSIYQQISRGVHINCAFFVYNFFLLFKAFFGNCFYEEFIPTNYQPLSLIKILCFSYHFLSCLTITISNNSISNSFNLNL